LNEKINKVKQRKEDLKMEKTRKTAVVLILSVAFGFALIWLVQAGPEVAGQSNPVTVGLVLCYSKDVTKKSPMMEHRANLNLFINATTGCV